MSNAATEPDLCLRVDVPICAFRPYESREYQDTHPMPPPSAVYGMLLSLCGIRREHRDRHLGVRIAFAIESVPERAKVFRKLRRGKGLDDLRPDYQDLLIGLKLQVWLQSGSDRAEPSLVERVMAALDRPQTVDRFGGLSLGESSYLVDSIEYQEPQGEQMLYFLKPDPAGFYSLPVWIDHAANTHLRKRFSIEPMQVSSAVDNCWITIENGRTADPAQNEHAT